MNDEEQHPSPSAQPRIKVEMPRDSVQESNQSVGQGQPSRGATTDKAMRERCEDYMPGLGDDIKAQCGAASREKRRYTWLYWTVGGAAAVLAGVAGVAGLADLVGPTIAGSVTIVSAALTGIATFARFGQSQRDAENKLMSHELILKHWIQFKDLDEPDADDVLLRKRLDDFVHLLDDAQRGAMVRGLPGE